MKSEPGLQSLSNSLLESAKKINPNLKNRCYYGGIAWYLLTHRVEDKTQVKVKKNEDAVKQISKAQENTTTIE